jgi:hypothetical protein
METDEEWIGMDDVPLAYSLEGQRRSPGRPTPDDGQLEFVRNDLAHLFAVSWADIGWQLKFANSRQDLARAFEPLRSKNNGHLVARFITATSLTANGSDVRSTRRLLNKTVTRRYDAQQNCHDPVREYREAQTAVMQAQPEQISRVRDELLKRQSKLLAVKKELSTARELEHTLQTRLAEQEAGFAQEQLVRILAERRCARHPLKLANAIAGLPSLTARVSAERCAKIKCTMWPIFDFQVFQKIESIWNSRHSYPGLSVVELYRQEIGKLPRTIRRNRIDNPLRKRLGDHFGCLKYAIQNGLKSGVDSDQMPFFILSNFDKNRAEPTTALTRTLAASEKID